MDFVLPTIMERKLSGQWNPDNEKIKAWEFPTELVYIQTVPLSSIYHNSPVQITQKTFSTMVKDLMDMGLCCNVGKDVSSAPKKLYFPLHVPLNSSTITFDPKPIPKIIEICAK